MATNEDAALFAVLTQLKADWPNRAWSWDSRLPTVASSISADQAAQAKAIAARALSQAFDAATLSTAPADVRAIIERSGGLRGNQLAFCGGTPCAMAFGLWWPWGGGATISLRVGLVGADTDDGLSGRLKALFGVS